MSKKTMFFALTVLSFFIIPFTYMPVYSITAIEYSIAIANLLNGPVNGVQWNGGDNTIPYSVFTAWSETPSGIPTIPLSSSNSAFLQVGPTTGNDTFAGGVSILSIAANGQGGFDYQFSIPNFNSNKEQTLMRTFFLTTDSVPANFSISLSALDQMGNPLSLAGITNYQSGNISDALFFQDWGVAPNPRSETFTVSTSNGAQLLNFNLKALSLEVPEPGLWLTLTGCLAFVGFLKMRRNQTQNAFSNK